MENYNPLVSVIINCFNGENYLREAIDSVIAQTYTNWELIFWDNQSTDSTADIVKSYNDERIHYFYAPEHTPLGEARNLAMEKANGEYIGFLDADDIWLHNFLLRAVECLENSAYSFFYSNYFNWISGQPEVINNCDKNSGSRNFEDFLTSYRVGMSAAVFRHDIIRNTSLRFHNIYRLIEDYDFFLKLVRNGYAYYESIPLMKYRMHEKSLTNSSKQDWAFEFELLHQDLINNILNVDEQKQYKKQLKWLRIRAINARAEELIDKGERFRLLKLIIKNIYLNIKLIFPLSYLFTSKENYYNIKTKIQKASYHI